MTGRFLDLLNWADSSLMQKRTAGHLSDGSAQWIFDRREFVERISSNDPGGRLLWCYGNGDVNSVCANISQLTSIAAGAGKTFIVYVLNLACNRNE